MHESPTLSSREKLEKSLTELGFGQDTRALGVLRAMMRIQSMPPRSLGISEIHDSLMRVELGTTLSKAWVRKVLKQLEDMQMIRVENESEPQRKYVSDTDTIVAGLEQLKGRTLASLETRTQGLREQLGRLESIEFGAVSRAITGNIASQTAQPTSRLLKGLESYREFADAEIYSRAGRGDIIRIAQVKLKSFGETLDERANHAIRAAENGADVRVLVSADLVSADQVLADSFPKTGLTDVFVRAYDVCQRGLKLDLRVYAEEADTYHFSSLNTESMVILVSEDPMAAMWVSRSFNPDLIETAIASFEQAWQRSTPLLQDPRRPELGVPITKGSFFLTALKAAARRVTGGET